MNRLPFAGFAAAFLWPAVAMAADALPATVPAGQQIIVADDTSGVRMLLKLSGEQDKLAAKVTYADFSSGPLRLEAMRAGAAQIGAVGDVPPILAQYSNAGVLIVGAVRTAGSAMLIATAPGSGIKTIGDLAGKRIAINDGTGQQAVLFRNLHAAGLGIADIKPIKLGIAEFVDALRSSQIDAAVLKQPDRARYLAGSVADGARELPNAPEAEKYSGTSYLYATRAALDDPGQAAAIRDLVIHWYRAFRWRDSHQAAWIDGYLIKDQKLKRPDAEAVAASLGNHTVFPGFTPALIAAQQQTIDILQAAHAFAGKHLDAKDEFDLRFADLNETSKASHD